MIIRKNVKPVNLDAECYHNMQIGSEYWGVTLGSIPKEGKGYCDKITAYLGRVEEAFLEGYGLFINGPPQTGKTSLAVVVAKHIYSWYTPATGISLLPMSHFIRSVINKKVGFYERRGLLILDDIGSEDAKDFSKSSLEGIIRFRCENRLPTIVTTNLEDKGIVSRYGENVLLQILRKSRQITLGTVDWFEINRKKMDTFFTEQGSV